MKIIGLTGGIATGKSTVAAMLRRLGATVIDADAISRSLTAKGGAALAPIREAFGDDVFSGAELNRPALAQAVFSDGEKRRLLNSIVHPLVYAQLEVLKEKARREGEKAVVLDIPLLFETGYEKQCDETWLVWLDEEDQRRRLMLRDNMEKRQAIARVNAQMPMCAKRQKATRIIDNSQAAEHTYKQVSELWENVNA